MNKPLHSHKKADSSASFPVRSQFQSRPFIAQAKPQSEKPLTQTETENQEFQQQKFEETKLKLQAKNGTITPEGQERLTVLQAKMSGLLQTRLEHASSKGSNFANIPISRPDAPSQLAVQTKLRIGEPGDKFEKAADEAAADFVQKYHAPVSQQAEKNLQPSDKLVEEKKLQKKPMSKLQSAKVGMTAAPEVEAAIKQARGGGQSMPEKVRQPYEQHAGANYSRVKIHRDERADTINRSIGALACTVGTDVFMRSGTYKPGTKKGDQLLRHELEHVGQQNGKAVHRQSALEEQDNLGDGSNSVSPSTINGGSVLQRAVGFEFECNWQVNKVGSKDRLQTFPKKTLLHQGAGWAMETDGTDIEFVVDHIDEGAAGRQQLQNVMVSLTAWAEQMNQQKAAAPIDNPTFVTVRKSGHTRVHTQNDDIKANPQTTGGIRLERLETLYRSLAYQPGIGPALPDQPGPPDWIPEATNVLGGQAPNFYARSSQMSVSAINAVKGVEVWPAHPASDKLAGLVGLICQYLEFGRGTAQLQTAKYMTWIMGRTKFGAMLLSTPEAGYLKENPTVWEDLVLTTAMTAMSGALPGGSAVIERPITDGGTLTGNQRIQIPITRHQWLLGMTKGKDLLTEHAQKISLYSPKAHKNTYRDTRTDLGHRLRGLGGLGKRHDTTSDGHRAEIVEFRSMMTRVPYTAWDSLALQVFDFIVAVNAADTSSDTLNMQG